MQNKKQWTLEEIKVVQAGGPSKDIAKKLGRCLNSIHNMKRRLKSGEKDLPYGLSPITGLSSLNSCPVSPATGDESLITGSTYEQDLERADENHWENSYRVLSRKYEAALKANSAVNQLVDDIKSLAPKSYQTAPAIQTLRKGSGQTPQSAMLLLSDTHIGQVVDPAQTLSYGGYNFPTFMARLKYLEESVGSIMSNHTVAKTEELVLAMLGDMIHGALVHSVEAGQKNDLFTQYFNGAHAIAQFIRNIARYVPKVRIKTVVGNHPRWGTQHKMPSDQRYSNGDQFFYALIQALIADISNVEFKLDKQPMQVFTVQGFKFLALHGDTLKGGGTAGIPALAYAKEVSARSQMMAAMGEKPVNYFISGHHHKPVSLPTTSGACLINGAFVGADGYTMSAAFTPVEPQQRLFFIHPKHGITAEYCLSLKWAQVTERAPYALPPGFPIV